MNYNWTLEFKEISTSWQKHGDEWISAITRHASEKMQASISVGPDPLGNHLEVTANKDGFEINVLLLVAAMNNGNILLGLGGTTPERSKLIISQWEEAVRLSEAELSSPQRAHKWTAIIGQLPSKSGNRPVRISSPGKISGLRLAEMEGPLWERFPSSQPSLSFGTFNATFPILVRGTSQGYDWLAAQVPAARQLHKLVAILSLAWDVRMEVREAATPTEFGDRTLPQLMPGVPEWPIDSSELSSQARKVKIPEWTNAAYVMIGRVSKYESALSMFMEGLRITDEHPSLALVAFTSTVETIGATIFPPDNPCDICKSNHRDVTAKFHKTLRLVVDEEEAQALTPVYPNRSKTVHAGRLYGEEITRGITSLRFFGSSPETKFQWGIVHRMQRAAQKLLLTAIQGGLPNRLEL